MSYRRTTPAVGGRRDRRERTAVRMRRTHVAAATIAVGAFAVGSFASAGMNAWAAGDRSDAQPAVTDQAVAPIAAEAADLEVVVRTEEVELDHGSVEEKDYDEYEGSTKVVTEGQDGTALVSYTVTLKDGVEVERDEDMRVVVEEPVDEVVAVGAMTKPSIPTTTNAGANRALGRELAAQRGWSGEQWNCLNALFTKESNWRHNAQNSSSGAYGIPQSLPGSKMASVGSDWRTNPATQITWGLNYISGRYGTPCGAWSHSQSRGWY